MSDLTDEQLRKWEQELPAMSPANTFSVAVVCLSHIIALRARVAQLENDLLIAQENWDCFINPVSNALAETGMIVLEEGGPIEAGRNAVAHIHKLAIAQPAESGAQSSEFPRA